ncbi:DDHD domain-containing protein [Lipomyces tetrasporus]
MPPWFFHNATAPLDDPSAPLPAPSTPAASTIPVEKESAWVPFTPEDNTRLEAAWHAMYVSTTHVAARDEAIGKGKGKSKSKQPAVSVIVGKARLYAVQFVPPSPENDDTHHKDGFDPDEVLGPCVAKLTPVYWHAMHDTAHVIRATWFYTSTLGTPNPMQHGAPRGSRYSSAPITDLSMVAKLERGFLQMEPWSYGYISELKGVRRTGRAAESKIKVVVTDGYSAVYWPLLPERPLAKRSIIGDRRVEEFRRDIPRHPDRPGVEDSYANRQEGFAVLIPEAVIVRTFAGRRSGVGRGVGWVLGAVPRRIDRMEVRMPGRGVEGVVRRGFDYDDWLRAGGNGPQGQWNAQDIKHLVLVVHGIGQKLSERVETFDFTYAINAFRVLMAKQHEVMSTSHPPSAVLPINWRRKINFDYEDAATSSSSDENKAAPVHRPFALSDITPNTIPTVRNIISDVLLDIPYYLSKHKSRVLHAVAAEANRVYRLWMRNNPGWQGKISIIGHSLGSVIAVDILSRQPTVPPPLGSQNENSSEEDELLLEFPVRNLFLAGSPVGFFLLLNRTNLMPRIMSKERLAAIAKNMPNSDDDDLDVDALDPADLDPDSIGIDHGGVYGCLAVENIYNVVHTSDPIAYRLNPCVDPEYAEKLRQAVLSVPIIRSGIFGRLFSKDKKPASPVQRHVGDAKDSVKNSIRAVATKTGRIVMRVFKPSYGAGERIEQIQDASKKKKVGVADDQRGILEPESDFDADENGSQISSRDDDFGQPPRRRPLPPRKATYSFTRAPSSSSITPQIELETRDFGYEKIVKTRMHCLNENGQIDFVLQPRGALENQYISILTAHSGYWESKEFAYLVAQECSRQEGVEHTMKSFRAVRI